MLSGYEKVRLVSESPYILISKSGLTFNKDAISFLKCSEWVDLLRNPDTKSLAVVPVNDPDQDSMPFFNSSKKNSNVVRWTNRKLIRLIELDMKWDVANASYKVFGKAAGDGLVFDLSSAIIIL